MKITNCPLKSLPKSNESIVCPACHRSECGKHGFYLRKGFHTWHSLPIPVKVPRYLCRNPECPCCTFSILPPMILRYCRFFWPCLLAIHASLSSGATQYHLARHTWHVGRGVLRRAATLVAHLGSWVKQLHRELTDGGPERNLALMVKIVTAKLGHRELSEQWYRHTYPLRFSFLSKNEAPHNSCLSRQ